MSLVTYTAAIAVRYPELDNVQNDLVCFGNYLLGEQATSGGFLPIFWDVPSAYMHAATDIGSAVDWLQRQVTLSSDENAQSEQNGRHLWQLGMGLVGGCSSVQERYIEVSPDLLVRVLVELVANYWSWAGGGGGTTPQPQN